MRALDVRLTLDLVFARSYEGTRSVGEVVSKLELRHGVAGRDVLLLDDILDSGRTLSKLSAELKVLNPASLRTCVLLDKPSRRVVPFKSDYVGFEIDDVFVVGYGLDYDGYYRNLPYIGGPPPLEPG
jgi:hypoxanthine phosphoribosyltransferase